MAQHSLSWRDAGWEPAHEGTPAPGLKRQKPTTNIAKPDWSLRIHRLGRRQVWSQDFHPPDGEVPPTGALRCLPSWPRLAGFEAPAMGRGPAPPHRAPRPKEATPVGPEGQAQGSGRRGPMRRQSRWLRSLRPAEQPLSAPCYPGRRHGRGTAGSRCQSCTSLGGEGRPLSCWAPIGAGPAKKRATQR